MPRRFSTGWGARRAAQQAGSGETGNPRLGFTASAAFEPVRVQGVRYLDIDGTQVAREREREPVVANRVALP